MANSLSEVIWFREDIHDARRKCDKRLWQYEVMFVYLLALACYCCYLYWAELSEFDSYHRMAFFTWFYLSKPIYLVAASFVMLSASFIHCIYFSPDMDYFMNWQKKIIVQKKSIKYHWPYHYKRGNCSDLIRKSFARFTRGYRSAPLCLGKALGSLDSQRVNDLLCRCFNLDHSTLILQVCMDSSRLLSLQSLAIVPNSTGPWIILRFCLHDAHPVALCDIQCDTHLCRDGHLGHSAVAD